MAIPYQNIARAIALRANQLVGGDAEERDTAYQDVAGIYLHMDGVEVPYGALRRDILAVEIELAEKIGNMTDSIYRAHLRAESADLVTGSVVPLTKAASVAAFVGSFDGIFDASDDLPLTEKSKLEVLRRIKNPNSMFVLPTYHYCFEGTKILHTRPAVYFQGCAFDKTAAQDAFDALGNSVLPAALEVIWIMKVLAGLPQENWFVQEAIYYRDTVSIKENGVIQGKIQDLQLPQMPATTTRIETAKD